MTDRSYDRNAGYLNLPHLPDDLFIAGAIIVTLNEDGELGATFVAESIDDVPAPEVQEELSALVRQAWHLANNPGMVIT
jgi:hypothetical protein